MRNPEAEAVTSPRTGRRLLADPVLEHRVAAVRERLVVLCASPQEPVG